MKIWPGLAALLLCACGGGGGAVLTSASNPAGLYGGYITTGSVTDEVFAIVDEAGVGTILVIDETVSTLEFKSVYRFLLPKGSSFATSYRQYAKPGSSFSGGATARSGNMTGDVTPRDSIAGLFGAGASAPNFVLLYSNAYEAPAPLATIRGTYQYSLPTAGAPVTVTWNMSNNFGVISGTDTASCSYSGGLTVTDAAYNAYRLNLRRTCGSAAPIDYSGMATYNPPSGSRRAFMLLEYDDGAGFGVAAPAIKQP